jgi:hypothetical protein
LKSEQFFITFGVRAPNLMWLIGAGGSASAGIPTAYHLIWQFKRRLYCASERVSLKSCGDLSNSAIKQRLQRHFDRTERFPKPDAPEEYAAYFEAAYPDAGDRRTIIEQYVRDATPSFGHSVLATLLSISKSRIVWTTNFDKLIEDATVKALGSTSRLVVASLDNAEVAIQSINTERWPIVGKLHGDFQSRKLKNTTEELKTQDAELRRAFVESCRRFGLVVVGYSGRDESVMQALTDALDSGNGFPAGLFWFHRPDSSVLPSVQELIEKAQKLGVQAELIEVYTFDELMGDIIKQLDDVSPELFASLQQSRPRISDVPLRSPGSSWPVIRTNALPVSHWPNVCRKMVCDIGGTKAVRETLTTARANAIATRSQVGVLAFGADSEIRRALSSFQILEEGFHSIELRRLYRDTAELGLIRDAFAIAVERTRPLIAQKRYRNSAHLFTVDDGRLTSAERESLTTCTGQLSGTVPNTSLQWSEAVLMKLEYRLGRLWCLIEPVIHVPGDRTAAEREEATSFVRERSASRYNQQWNSLLEAWSSVLAGSAMEVKLQAYGPIEGADASFTIGRTTAFSRREIL